MERSVAIALALVVASGCGDDDAAPPPAIDGGAGDDAPAAMNDAGAFRYDAALAPRLDGAALVYPLDDVLRLNQIQAEATHNSYHLRPEDVTLVPDSDYQHAPLEEQLESQGVRGVELDTHFDATIGAHRVYHVSAVDMLSTCDLFVECLADLRRWSDAHPGHHTLFVQIEPKDRIDNEETAAVRLEQLESEIQMVWPPDLIVTPAMVQGESASLAQAIAERGWPTLGETRGRALFYIDCGGACSAFTHGSTRYDGQITFVRAHVGDPYGAVLLLNNPLLEAEQIRAAVAAGYIVRTFAEPSLASARANDRTWLDMALSLGAQIVSTDFPAPTEGTDYYVEMPGGTPSRCNPVTGPPTCTSLAIEDASLLAP